MKDRFDLENEIMDCWSVVDDLNMVTKHFIDSPQWKSMSGELADALMNKYGAISELYELKFQTLFETFGDCIPNLKSSIEDYVEDNEEDLGVPWETDEVQLDLRLNDVTPAEWDEVTSKYYK